MKDESSTQVQKQALRKTEVICRPQRVNVFDAKGKLIGQDYQRDNGDWMHKWIDPKTGTFERGSWRGRCKGEDMQNWSYEDCIQLANVRNSPPYYKKLTINKFQTIKILILWNYTLKTDILG